MGDVLVYLPPECRQHNMRGSCVFASITTCMRCAGCWKEADKFWSRYRGPGNPQNTKRRLDECGAKYKMIYHCDEASMMAALNSGRPIAVAWGGAHFVNLVGRINGNAYIVDNNSPNNYKVRPWPSFLQSHRSSGGWGVIILNGKAAKPIEKKSLGEFEASLKAMGLYEF